MRPPLRHERSPIGLNMTPLIDVVFQLIIFFLVSSHLARQETQLELDLPAAASGREATVESRPRVVINVAADGHVLLGSTAIGPDELTPRLKFERRRSGSDLEVRIRADRSVPYAAVEPVLLSCADAGIWNVTFAVFKKDQSRVSRVESQN
jgi:biopolymer transport protein ExbD